MPIKPMGGQAVMEGVMIKCGERTVMCVRRKNGEITTVCEEKTPIAKRHKWMGWPVIRGFVNLIEQLGVGFRMLMKSANFIEEDEGVETSSTGSSIAMGTIGVLSVLLALAIFFAAPTFLAGLFLPPGAGLLALEGAFRLLLFAGYVAVIALMPDMRRVYMYHGAEHQALFCYEHGEQMTPENARKYSRLHPRCGTNYLFLVMIVSIVIFSLLGVQANPFLRAGIRILVIPLVAGVAYEVLKLFARQNNILAKIVRAPGLALQYLTTREPTDDMLEVAAAAVRAADDDV